MVKVEGTDDIFDLVPAPGEISNEGTFVNKSTLLKDATATLFGLGADAVPDDVFAKLSAAAFAKNTMIADVGESFSTKTVGAAAQRFCVAYGNGKFVIATYNSGTVAYSTDGTNWTETNTGISSTWYGMAYGNGKFVAVSTNSSTYMYSEDGIAWTRGTLPINIAQTGNINFCNGVFLASGMYESNLKYATSTDGINWTNSSQLPANDSGFGIRGVYVANNMFWAFPTNSSTVYYSTDGVTWNTGTHNLSWTVWGIAHNGSVYVAHRAVSTSTEICYSSDGFNWTTTNVPSGQYRHVTCVGSKFIAFPKEGVLALVSDDGIHWDSVSIPYGEYESSANNGRALVVLNNQSVATVLYSEKTYELSLVDVQDNFIATLSGAAKIATGSYTGTGTYGASNPNSLTFDFEPKLVLVSRYGLAFRSNGSTSVFFNHCFLWDAACTSCNITDGSNTHLATFSISGATLSWYTSGAATQLNTSGATYYYAAIG